MSSSRRPQDCKQTPPPDRHAGRGAAPADGGGNVQGTSREELSTALQSARADLESTVDELAATNKQLVVANEELRRAEQALRDSETRLNRAQAIAHLGSWELNLLENSLTWSDEVYRIFGLQPQEFRATYEAFLEAVHPDDRAKVDAAYQGSLREGRDSYEIEHRVVRRSTGEVRVVHEKCQHVRNAEGQIVASIGMVHDITDQKQAEEVIAESRRKTVTILESITDCCFEVDSEWRFTYVDERALAFLGRRLDQCLGRTYWEVFPEAIGSDLETHCRRAVAEHTAVHFESRSTTMDRWADFHANPSGTGLTVYFRDITSRKLADEALRVSEARLQTVVENLSEGLVVAESGGLLAHWNPAAVRMHGFASADEGRKVLKQFEDIFELRYLNGALVPFEQWPMSRVMRGERLRDLEVEVRRRTGDWKRIFSYAGDLVRDEGGRPLLGVLSVTDVTERKRAEQALREANDRLRQADQHKNEFLAILSHELRNPLAPIRNSLYILERTPEGGEQARLAQAVMNRQIAQLSRLVDDLLDVTRISRNKIQLRRERVDLCEIVRRAVDDQRSLFEKSRVTIETALAGSTHVNADSERVAQIVSNLLQNAAKFTPAGGTVRVLVAGDRAAGKAVIRIADTGVGMSPEIVSRLFRPFMQADSTLDRSRGGLGLGLALVKGVVDLHGGTVTAQSDGVGRGSVFTVRLDLDCTGMLPPDTTFNLSGLPLIQRW